LVAVILIRLPNVRILTRNVLTTTLDAEKRVEYSLPAEGYHVVLANKLDANHDTPIEKDDLPELIAAYRSKDERWTEWQAFCFPFPSGEGPGERVIWPQKWWFADTQTLRSNDFNLSAGRYRPMNQAAVEHLDPRELLDELAAIEAEIVEEVEALRSVLSEEK
jgi:type I restriction enzyme M protein